MAIFSLVLFFLKNVFILAAVYCGIFHHHPYSILLLSTLVLILQSIEYKDFALDRIIPNQSQSFLLSKKLVLFALPTISFITCSYLVGFTIHQFI